MTAFSLPRQHCVKGHCYLPSLLHDPLRDDDDDDDDDDEDGTAKDRPPNGKQKTRKEVPDIANSVGLFQRCPRAPATTHAVRSLAIYCPFGGTVSVVMRLIHA